MSYLDVVGYVVVTVLALSLTTAFLAVVVWLVAGVMAVIRK